MMLYSAVPTHFLLNFAVFAIHSTSEKPFWFRCSFQNMDPCAAAAFSSIMVEKSLRSLQNQCLLIFQTDSPSVGKGRSLHLHMQVSGYMLGTVQKISCVPSSIWCPKARSCCNRGSHGQPRHSLG